MGMDASHVFFIFFMICSCSSKNPTGSTTNLLNMLIMDNNLKHLVIISDQLDVGIKGSSVDHYVQLYDLQCSDVLPTMDYEDFLQDQGEKRLRLNVVINCRTLERSLAIAACILPSRYGKASLLLVVPFYNIMIVSPILPNPRDIGDFVRTDLHIKIIVIVEEKVPTDHVYSRTLYNYTRPSYQPGVTTAYTFMIDKKEFRTIGKVPGTYEPGSMCGELLADFNGFHNHTIRVGYIQHETFLGRKVSSATNTTIYHGVLKQMLDILAEKLVFSYEFVESYDGFYGISNERGEWNGLVGMLQKREIDMVLSSLTISAERREVIDFSYPYLEDPVVISYMDNRLDTGVDWLFLLKPFKVQVWLSVAAALVLTAYILWWFEVARVSQMAAPESVSIRGKSSGGREMFWNVFGGCLNQSFFFLPVSSSSRVVMTSFWCASLLILAAYNGNLKADMAVPEGKSKLESLKDLIQDSRYTLVLNGGGANRDIIENSKQGVLKDLWQMIQKNKEFSLRPSSDDAYGLSVEMPWIAAVGDLTLIMLYMRENGKCNWSIIPEDLFRSSYGLGFPKNSPYTDIFSERIMTMLEMGLISAWENQYSSATSCSSGKDRESLMKPLSLWHIQAMIILLTSGISLSLMVFLCERVFPMNILTRAVFQWKVPN